MQREYDTVDTAEKVLERTWEGKMVSLQRAPSPSGEVVTTRVQNFACPACTETLPEAVAVNGRVRGWCGNKHVLVNVII